MSDNFFTGVGYGSNWVHDTVERCHAMIEKHLSKTPAPLKKIGMEAHEIRAALAPKKTADDDVDDAVALAALKTIRSEGRITAKELCATLRTNHVKLGCAVAELIRLGYPIQRIRGGYRGSMRGYQWTGKL